MTAEQLRHSLLQEAISGRLVPQDPNDEPASALLARIREEKERLIKEKKLKKEKPSAPITEDEIPYEIPATWEWVRISDICSIVNGFTPRRTEPKFWTNGTINWFTVEDINKQGEIIRYTEQKITKAATSEDRIVRPGSVLLCCTASVGRCAITEVPVTTNQQFNALTVKDEYRKAVSDTYILTIAKTLEPTLHQLAGQTTFEFVSVTKVGNIVIPIPPLAEQARIVAKLDEVLPIVEQYGKAQTELNELNVALPSRLYQSVLQEAMSGKLLPQDPNDEPASVLLQRLHEVRRNLYKKGIIKKKDFAEYTISEDEIPFELPQGWAWEKLGNLTIIISDGTHKTPKYVPTGIPFLSVQNISGGKLDLSKIKYISQAEHTELVKRIKPQKDDILICRIGTLGKAIRITWDFDFSIFVSLGLIRIVDASIVDYIIRVINSPIGNNWIQENKVGGGTHTYKINLGDIPNMLLPIPPLAEQQRIVAKIEELFAEIDKLK